jgi:hypothetical protein
VDSNGLETKKIIDFCRWQFNSKVFSRLNKPETLNFSFSAIKKAAQKWTAFSSKTIVMRTQF